MVATAKTDSPISKNPRDLVRSSPLYIILPSIRHASTIGLFFEINNILTLARKIELNPLYLAKKVSGELRFRYKIPTLLLLILARLCLSKSLECFRYILSHCFDDKKCRV